MTSLAVALVDDAGGPEPSEEFCPDQLWRQ
jgi:hypothetical protein